MKYNPVKAKIPRVMIKEKILESAFNEFSKSGYFTTNPDAITKSIHISRVAFYSYFKNKNDILIYLIRELMDDLSGLVKDKRTHKLWLNTNVFNDFQEPFLYITEVLNSCSGLVRAFLQGMTEEKELLSEFDEVCKSFSQLFEDKIRSLQNVGQFQGCDPHVMAQIMAITLFMSIFTHSIDIIECTPKQLAKNIALIFHAVLNFDEKKIKKTNSNGPKSEKSRKTRRTILLAAQKAFDKHGYQKVTMEKIAQAAECSRATVYLYYKRKKDILQALEKESFALTDALSEAGDAGNRAKPDFIGREADNQEDRLTKSQKTRRKILLEARKALADNGYFETTIESIARKAGCSRSTMYLHFKKKDEIVRFLFQEMTEEINPANLAYILNDIDLTSIDDLMRLNSVVMEAFDGYAMVNWALLQGTFYSEALADYFKDLYHQFSLPINKIIDSLKKQGKCKGVNTHVASSIIITCICYSISMYHAGIIKCSKHEFLLNLAKFLSGFLNFIPEEDA